MSSNNIARTINIYEADFQNIKPCASVMVLGKRRSGKTTLSKHITQYLDSKINRFVAFCGNLDAQVEWKSVIPPLFVHGKNLESLRNIVAQQDEMVSCYTEKKQDIPKEVRICIIMDDCGCDKDFLKTKVVKDLFSNGRHYGITIVILCQYIYQIDPEIRTNIDYLAILRQTNVKNIKKIYDEFASFTKNMEELKHILELSTTNYGCCWIDNTAQSSLVQKCIFFKRNTLMEFKKVGSQKMWEYSEKHHITRDMERMIKKSNQKICCEEKNKSIVEDKAAKGRHTWSMGDLIEAIDTTYEDPTEKEQEQAFISRSTNPNTMTTYNLQSINDKFSERHKNTSEDNHNKQKRE